MVIIIYRKSVYHKTNDKYNDNVICYDAGEVILCR